jgi:hypothetical protein
MKPIIATDEADGTTDEMVRKAKGGLGKLSFRPNATQPVPKGTGKSQFNLPPTDRLMKKNKRM